MSYVIDQASFKLGVIAAFSEMVGVDLKKMALSSPFMPKEYDVLHEETKKIAKRWGVKVRLEKELLITDLFPEELTNGKWVSIIYKHPEVIDNYLGLKAKREQLIKENVYLGKERKAIAVRFGELLGYDIQAIEKILKKTAEENTISKT